MSRLLPPRRLLASCARGWQIHELIDGTVHLVLGTPGLVFARSEFAIFTGLLTAGDRPLPAEDVALAILSPTRAIAYLAIHERLVIQFDQLVITVRPADLPLLLGLCRKARSALEGPCLVPFPAGAEQLRWN
ncbi:MAG: hypothetical protein OHK0015_07760 [Chloroflexi bacterium OHK40]